MLKKTMVLAIAVGLVAAFALPFTASAKWTHHEKGEIQENVDLELEGSLGLSSGSGQVGCQVTSTALLFAFQTTGQLSSLTSAPEEEPTLDCSGSGGFVGCQIHGVQPLEMPWQLHTTGTAETPTITGTFGDIHIEQTGLFCPYRHLTVTGSDVVFQPTDEENKVNAGKTVDHFDLSGTLQAHLYSATPPPMSQMTVTMQVKGIWRFENPFDRGTYNI